jgi:hypothetical protein
MLVKQESHISCIDVVYKLFMTFGVELHNTEKFSAKYLNLIYFYEMKEQVLARTRAILDLV